VWQVASGKWQDLGKGNIEHPTSNIEHRMPEKDGCVRGSTPSLAFAFLRSSAFAEASARQVAVTNPRPSASSAVKELLRG
jgi:hypothetical protein